MPILNQSTTRKPLVSQQASARFNYSRLCSVLASAVLIGMTASFSANASTFISARDFLDYELPKTVQGSCSERQNCPEIEVKYLTTNHDWINKATNARIDNLVVNSKPTETVPITITGAMMGNATERHNQTPFYP
ncbi:hypothetical protein [Psychrobacter urativorans]|uniref:hypothetical protein n=1 Tax=Psychrobacter urativorans TaxID=45610 RepID=UPI001919A32D|nr:hypothetical protein [Psychrobacter urativorans]